MSYEWEVPEHALDEFEPRAADYCICVFVIDEGDRLISQLKRMSSFAALVDIVLVDGGSQDGSTDPQLLKSHGVNTLLVKTGEGKLGSQMRIAFAWALKRGYQGVVVVDGNNKDGIEAIPAFVHELQQGFDFVQGSRFVAGGYHENTPLSRLMGVKLIHAPLLSLAAGFRYTDSTNGFRAYSAKLLYDPFIKVFRNVFQGYELHYFLAMEAGRKGYRCTEIPVSRCYPRSGPVPTKISPIAGNIEVFRRLVAVILGRYGERNKDC